MQSIFAVSLLGLTLFSSTASACGMPPASGMSLAKAMEQVEAAPVLSEAKIAEVEVNEAVLADAMLPPEIAEPAAEEPAVLVPAVLVPQVHTDGPTVLVPVPVVLPES